MANEPSEDFDLQAPWVGTLLDVGNMRVQFEEHAKSDNEEFYGQGKVDDLHESERNKAVVDAVYAGYLDKPNSWSRLLNYLTARVVTSSQEELRGNLVRLSALAVAWVDDIDRRSLNGAKAGK